MGSFTLNGLSESRNSLWICPPEQLTASTHCGLCASADGAPSVRGQKWPSTSFPPDKSLPRGSCPARRGWSDTGTPLCMEKLTQRPLLPSLLQSVSLHSLCSSVLSNAACHPHKLTGKHRILPEPPAPQLPASDTSQPFRSTGLLSLSHH